MTIKENQQSNNESKEYKIYLRREKQFIPVSKEVYYEYYRPIWAQRKKAQSHGQCTCPHQKLWMCDGDCFTCPYHSTGDSLSLDFEYACGDGKTTLADSIEDPVNLEVNIMRQILLDDILADFKQLDAEGARIYELLGEDLSERKIAETLGRTQSTFNYQIRKIRTELKKSYPDIF